MTETLEWREIGLWVTFGLVATIAVALTYGASRWRSATGQLHARLKAGCRVHDVKTYTAAELIGLPAPVQRYFRAVLTDGQPIITGVRIEQTGVINMSETGEQWKPFSANQCVITQRPGFDWDARVAMMPGLAARVHDAYIAGEGMLHASMFGLVSLAKLRGTPEAAHAELMRFLAEAAWYPTALLPSQGVQWEAVDDASAKVTLKDGNAAVTLLIRFNERGLIESGRAEARARLGQTPAPWEGRLSHYELRDGMQVPLEGEAAWVLPLGPKTYWRGRITALRYEFA